MGWRLILLGVFLLSRLSKQHHEENCLKENYVCFGEKNGTYSIDDSVGCIKDKDCDIQVVGVHPSAGPPDANDAGKIKWYFIYNPLSNFAKGGSQSYKFFVSKYAAPAKSVEIFFNYESDANAIFRDFKNESAHTDVDLSGIPVDRGSVYVKEKGPTKDAGVLRTIFLSDIRLFYKIVDQESPPSIDIKFDQDKLYMNLHHVDYDTDGFERLVHGVQTRNSIFLFKDKSTGSNILLNDPKNIATKEKVSGMTPTILGIIISVILVCILILACACYWFLTKDEKKPKKSKETLPSKESNPKMKQTPKKVTKKPTDGVKDKIIVKDNNLGKEKPVQVMRTDKTYNFA